MSNILPIYEMDELQTMFEFPNRRSLQTALRTGRLPLKTFWLRGRRVCHVGVVERFFEMQKEEGIEQLEDHAKNNGYDWDR